MKKRIISLLLLISLCFSMLASSLAYAAEPVSGETGSISADITSSQDIKISPWALSDLIVGDTYGIYPLSWYEKGEGVTAPITNSQLRILLAGVRNKILNSGCAVEGEKVKPDIKNGMTVEEVLNAIYATITSYIYFGDIGLDDGGTAVSFMAKNGIFTGNEGGLSLSDICTVEQACIIATRAITYIYDMLDAASKGFFWEVKSGKNTVYLLGSIHIATHDIYPFSKDILDAYAASDALAVEVNILDPNGAAILAQYGVYSDGTTLADHVSGEVYNKVLELAPLLGIDPEYVVYYKPWFLESLFSNLLLSGSGNQFDTGLAASLGIDIKFTLDATIEGKPILEVEGVEGQALIMDSYSDELEEYMLNSTLDALYEQLSSGISSPSTIDYLDFMLSLWRYGDVETFESLVSYMINLPDYDTDEETWARLNEEYIDKKITQRDKFMADYIDELLKGAGSTTYFVVLGCAHLISDYDIRDILAERGYEINQIR